MEPTRARHLRRNLDRHQRAAPGVAGHVEARLVAIENFQPLLHVFHADAGAGAAQRGAAVAHAHAVVGHFDEIRSPSSAAAQRDRAAMDARLKSMLDAVLDERLQQDAGHQNLERARIDLLFHAQLVGAEADHLDVEIIVGKLQLLAQRNVGVMVLEQGAQNVGQLDGHLAGQLRLAAHQRGDGVERIEEEMGIDLALQGVKAGFKQQPLLLFKRHLDAQRIPDLERDADHDGRAEPDQRLQPKLPASSAKRRCGKAWAIQSRIISIAR